MNRTPSNLTPLQAYEEVLRFAARAGEDVLRLAFHASVPQVLRPDLLHLLKLNFLPELISDAAAESDVLFAPFCVDLGNGYYRFDPSVRFHLLHQLDPTYEGEANPRSRQVASFLLAYIEEQSHGIVANNDAIYATYLEVERWVALAFYDPDSAAQQFAIAVREVCEEKDIAARLTLGGLSSALATPLAQHHTLLAYAAGVEALKEGDVRQAHDLLDPLGETEISFAGVTLRAPRHVLSERLRKTPKTNRPPSTEEAEDILHDKPPSVTAQDKQRNTLFFSYSHQDQRWVDRLKIALMPLIKAEEIEIFDTQLRHGDAWLTEMDNVLVRMRVAIILVSSDYLASEYCLQELSRLKSAAESGEIIMTWCYLTSCDYRHSPVENLQVLHDIRNPLSLLKPSQRHAVLIEIAQKVRSLLRARPLEKAQHTKHPPAPPQSKPATKIYISYRREDSADVTGRIYDRLVREFGREVIFKDIDSIRFGVDFRTYINEQIAKCDMFLVVIGTNWLKERSSKAPSRLENPADFVRIEIESALKQQIPVIPVLVSGTSVPSPDRLPASIRDLSYRNGLAVRPDPHFHRDMDGMINYLKSHIQREHGAYGEEREKHPLEQQTRRQAAHTSKQHKITSPPTQTVPDLSISGIISFLQDNDNLIKQLMETAESAHGEITDLSIQVDHAREEAKALIDQLGAAEFVIGKQDETRVRQRALLVSMAALRKKFESYQNDPLRRGIYAAEISNLYIQLANTFNDETVSQIVPFSKDEIKTYKDLMKTAVLDAASRKKRIAVLKAAMQISRFVNGVASMLTKH